MTNIRDLIGQERSLAEVSRTIQFWASAQGAASVGALHTTCSDESEQECSEAFQHGFVGYLLPQLKFARRSAFRLANLGARYEWGAARLAEDRYVAARAMPGKTLMVAKLNSHVAFEEQPGVDQPFRLGTWVRYGKDSSCCGALAGLLGQGRGPHNDDLTEAFTSEGLDRISMLKDPKQVDPALRPLFAAIVSGRLQARKLVVDVQEHPPDESIRWVVLPCVTINRHERDTEILCGIYEVEGDHGRRPAVYTGLGDDPSNYKAEYANGMFRITDNHVGKERRGRDHREIVREMLSRRVGSAGTAAHEELDRVRRDVERNKHHHHAHARTLLKIALPILMEIAPVPAAILAFAQGAAGVHHVFKIHRLAEKMEGDSEARQVLQEIHGKLDEMDGEHVQALLELLMDEYASGKNRRQA